MLKNFNWVRFILFTAIFALVIHYVSGPGKKAAEVSVDISGQAFTPPVSRLEAEPLQRQVELGVPAHKWDTQRFTVATDLCNYTFSPYDATLAGVEFKKHKDDAGMPIRTVYDNYLAEEHLGSLLLTTQEGTPLGYEVVAKDFDNPAKPAIEFATKFNGWRVHKRYTFSNDDYSVKMQVHFVRESKPSNPLQPRVIFNSPYGSGTNSNVTSGVVNTQAQSVASKIPAAQEEKLAWKLPTIFGGEDKFFLHALYTPAASQMRRAYFDRRSHDNLVSIVELEGFADAANFELDFYFGPKRIPDLAAVSTDFEPLLAFGFMSWLCKLILSILERLYEFLGNYGLTIIILTLLIKLLFFPVFIYAKNRMAVYERFKRANAKKIADIERRYASDAALKMEKTSELFASHGLSQWGQLLSAFPMLLPLIIIFPLYRTLYSYIGLNNAPFMLWLQDLSAPDPLYLLPIFIGLASWLQQRLMSKGQMMAGVAKTMQNIMPFIPVLIFSKLPSGAALFWLSNSVLSIGEELFYRKFLSKDD